MTKILAIGILGSDAQHGGMHGAAGAVGQAQLALGEDGYHRSFAALKRGGLLCAYGSTARAGAASHAQDLDVIARVYLWRRLRSW